jgi:hypothetical protein
MRFQHHITVVKCVSGSPKIILDARFGLGRETALSWPECSPDLNPLDISVGIFENQGLFQYVRCLERTCRVKLSKLQMMIKNSPEIFKRL